MDVVGLGTVVIDHIVVLPEHPEADTKQHVLSDHLQVGGPVPTALATLRRFGRSCAFVGSWGSDPWGQLIDTDFAEIGIDARHAPQRPEARTGFAHVWVCGQTARRTIAYQRSTDPVVPDELPAELIMSAQALHLDGWPGEAALVAARIAREHEVPVFLDAGSPKPGMEELLQYVDVLNAPFRFLNAFLGHEDVERGSEELLQRGPRLVTVTNGDAGAWLRTPEQFLFRPAFSIEAVDTTGAGDCFTGGLIEGVLSGFSPEESLAFAMATAACKCRAIGNREALPMREEVERLVHTLK